MNSQSPAIPEKAIAALKSGRKIEAIKITRAETGLHLKESKEAVERYIASDPSLSVQFKSQGNLPLILLVLAILAFAIYLSLKLG